VQAQGGPGSQVWRAVPGVKQRQQYLEHLHDLVQLAVLAIGRDERVVPEHKAARKPAGNSCGWQHQSQTRGPERSTTLAPAGVPVAASRRVAVVAATPGQAAQDIAAAGAQVSPGQKEAEACNAGSIQGGAEQQGSQLTWWSWGSSPPPACAGTPPPPREAGCTCCTR
jgi:hypothetical protein